MTITKPLQEIIKKRKLTLRDLYFKINEEIKLSRLSDIRLARVVPNKEEIEILSKHLDLSDKEIEDFLKFLEVANNTCKEKGKHYEFICRLCGNKAQRIRNTYNGHLWAKCSNCDMNVIQ